LTQTSSEVQTITPRSGDSCRDLGCILVGFGRRQHGQALPVYETFILSRAAGRH